MSVASHDIGASNAIEILNNPWMEMLQVSLVRIFWPILGEVARAASHDIGSRCAIRSFWRNLRNVANDPGHDIGATFAIEQVVNNIIITWSGARAACHEIGVKCAIESFP